MKKIIRKSSFEKLVRISQERAPIATDESELLLLASIDKVSRSSRILPLGFVAVDSPSWISFNSRMESHLAAVRVSTLNVPIWIDVAAITMVSVLSAMPSQSLIRAIGLIIIVLLYMILVKAIIR